MTVAVKKSRAARLSGTRRRRLGGIVTDAHIRILRRVARQRRLELDDHDAADQTAERKLDADGDAYSNP